MAMMLFGIGLVLATAVWSGAMPSDAETYPSESEIVEHPDRYVGDEIVVDGPVVDTNPVVVAISGPDGESGQFTVTGISKTVEHGDELRVYGVLTDSKSIHSFEAIVISPWELRYAWVISFLAGLWVLVRFARHWTFDRSELVFQLRQNPENDSQSKRPPAESDADA